jgi:HK97 family phage prohead protease
MNLQTLDFSMEIKGLSDTGSFSGYAAVFGNVDGDGDVIERGAFKEFWLTRDGSLRVLNQHKRENPIGKAQVKQDDYGLWFDAQLLMEVPEARTAHSLMKSGLVEAMSVGYNPLRGGVVRRTDGGRTLTALRLNEISPVTFPANTSARIHEVKAANAIGTIREFEEFLRDVGGFSAQQAKRIASAGWATTEPVRDEPGTADTTTKSNDLLAELKAFSFNLSI